MKHCAVLITILFAAAGAAWPAGGDWTQMFDGKTLDGWKATELPENWTVEDGSIVGRGPRSHLFWMKQECVDCEFKAEVKISDKGNSGMYFRAKFKTGWPDGYEAQVNSSHTDWRRTGSLYNLANVKERLVPPDTWFTQHISVKGNHIVIRVNDKIVVDYVDEKNTHTRGNLALQQHDPGSTVHYRNLRMRPIP